MKTVEVTVDALRERKDQLRTGQRVRLSGNLLVSHGDSLRLLESALAEVEGDRTLVLYHGSALVKGREGARKVSSLGPASCHRYESLLVRILNLFPVSMVIGQGAMGDAMSEACAARGCVYLQAVGNTGALNAGRTVAAELFAENGDADPVWQLEVSGLEAVVSIDSCGRNQFRRAKTRATRQLKALLKERF